MPANFVHGPEVIEHKDGVTVVRDVKSAVTYVNGCANIGAVHDTAEKRAEYINKRHIVRSRADAAAMFGPQTDGFNIPQALDAIFDESAGGTIIVNNVFDPDTHANVAAVTDAEIVGEVKGDGSRTGLQGAVECHNRFGFFPKIFLSDRSSIAGVRLEMDQMAHLLNGHAVCDLPIGLTKQQAVEARGTEGDANTSSARTILCYPHVKVADLVSGNERLEPLSQRLVGAMINTDLQEGYHHSPSNREIHIVGTEVDINFVPGSSQNDTDMLNEAGIVTCMRSFGTGFRTWGNRSAAFPSSSHVENFIHARRILDQTHEAITHFSMQYVDKLGHRKNVEALEEGVNAYLRRKIGDGVFYGAKYRFDKEKNTKEQIADGRFHYVLECHPTSVMERLTHHSYVDTKFIASALSLAA